jgi:prepilin-type N-terminal cleavage/methylation domain-containing protein
MKKKQKTSGFTLVELMIVLTVMCVLSTVSFKVCGFVRNYITRQQKITNAWRYQMSFLKYYDYYGHHPGHRFKPNRWFLLSDANMFVLFKEFMSDHARQGVNDDRVIFFQPTPLEQQKAPAGSLWFYLVEGYSPNPLTELNEELNRAPGTEVPLERVFGWGTEVLFYVP